MSLKNTAVFDAAIVNLPAALPGAGPYMAVARGTSVRPLTLSATGPQRRGWD